MSRYRMLQIVLRITKDSVRGSCRWYFLTYYVRKRRLKGTDVESTYPKEILLWAIRESGNLRKRSLPHQNRAVD